MNTTPATPAFHDRLSLAVGETSYRQLGTITATHPETVRRYMQGQAPSASFMTNLCRNLGISGEWLLSGKGPMRVQDIRTHALKNADPNELMGAIANTLTELLERVDRLDRFVQIIETRLNASAIFEPKTTDTQNITPADTISNENPGSDDVRATIQSGPQSNGQAAGRAARAIAERSSDDAA